MFSTTLKNISQIGSFPQVRRENKTYLKPGNSDHPPAIPLAPDRLQATSLDLLSYHSSSLWIAGEHLSGGSHVILLMATRFFRDQLTRLRLVRLVVGDVFPPVIYKVWTTSQVVVWDFFPSTVSWQNSVDLESRFEAKSLVSGVDMCW